MGDAIVADKRIQLFGSKEYHFLSWLKSQERETSRGAAVNFSQEEIAAERRSQVGTGDRSGKIRTYNFPQNRVTDHRLTGDNKNFNIAAVMNGDLDPMIDALILNDQAQRLQESKEE